MTGKPEVTVVVPCWNAAETVDAALDSIAAQEGVRWEAVLVDDGSTDGTGERLAARARSDPRFRMLSFPRPHGGSARARNAGLATARSDVVSFLDADDLLLPGALARGVELLRRVPEAAVVFFDWEERDGEGRLLASSGTAPFRSLARARGVPVAEDARRLDPPVFYPVLLRGNCLRVGGTGVRREVLRDAGGFDETLRNGDDYDAWLRLARAHPFIQCRQKAFVYRRHQEGISGRGPGLLPAKLRVLERQRPVAREFGATGILRRRLAAVHEGLGWAAREAGDLAEARRAYRRSLAARPGLRALWGWVSTWLPRRVR